LFDMDDEEDDNSSNTSANILPGFDDLDDDNNVNDSNNNYMSGTLPGFDEDDEEEENDIYADAQRYSSGYSKSSFQRPQVNTEYNPNGYSKPTSNSYKPNNSYSPSASYMPNSVSRDMTTTNVDYSSNNISGLL